VTGFANDAPPLGGTTGWPAVPWLAGLLEGEGTFLRPIPSSPAAPIVSCRMTDRDVVEIVADAFGVAVQSADKGRHKPEYAACLKGARAAELMRLVRPMMSARRKEAIDRALDGYRPPIRKLNYAMAEEIRNRHALGTTISSLACSFGVSRPTIRAVIGGRFHAEPERGHPWLRLSRRFQGATAAGTGLNWKELYWLAGWLEAEGSFCKPPPSNPRRPRIHGGSADADVIREVARLLGVTPTLDSNRRPNRSPYWRVLLRGGRAIFLMQAIRPVMGTRRTDQIDAALSSARHAGAVVMEPAGFEPASSATSDRLLQV
jgi:hypothetical protein